MAVDERLLRELTPGVIGALVGRGADFATAEDAVQEALIRAWETWPADPPTDPRAWLITVAWRRFLDLGRSFRCGQRRSRNRSHRSRHGHFRSDHRQRQLYRPLDSESAKLKLQRRYHHGLCRPQFRRGFHVQRNISVLAGLSR